MAPWIRKIAAVEAAESRLALWAEALAGLAPPDGARLLAAAVRAALSRRPGAVRAYLPLLRLDDLAARTGPGRLAEVLEAARELDLGEALLILEHPGRPRSPGGLGHPPDPLVEAVTLGHRKAAARGPRSPLLDRLLGDPDPRVIREVLRNPRLREAEVVAIASRRPCPEGVFLLLAGSEAWIRRPAVQGAVLRNPHAPPRLALALLVLQPGPLLCELANDEGLHPAVREGALQVLGWRAASGAQA